jgi:hypothetical protein
MSNVLTDEIIASDRDEMAFAHITYRLCENSKNIEKWRAAIELLRASGRAMDEKCRKSPAISWLPPARSSFHTVCLACAR